MNFYIALDVGGTNIKSGIITEDGTLYKEAIHMTDSHSLENKDTLITHFTNIILSELAFANELDMLLGIGIGFPGPFDYKNGISKITGINKYDSLYNVNIKAYIQARLIDLPQVTSRMDSDFDIRFENDATLYALGELIKGNAATEGKCLCVCIGTGLGSAFLEDGTIINSRSDIPLNGWVYATSFKNSIIDDHLSARGIMGLYNSIAPTEVTNVKSIADAYANGDQCAIDTFNTFGSILAEGLNIFLQKFPATTIVIGGQISKSYHLFQDNFEKNLINHPTIRISPDTSRSALIGTKGLF